VLWTMATALALVRARTLWAILRGLKLRVVNVDGLSDVAAVRGALLSFAAVGAGAAFFFLLRRSGRADRESALFAAVLGTAVSGGVAVAQRFGALATETRPYWRMAGRFSGGAVDPNALGILGSCAVPVAAAIAVSSSGGRRAVSAISLPVLVAGLMLSGSRSGLGLAAIGLGALLFARSIQGRRRVFAVLAAGALLATIGMWGLSGPRGGAGARLLELFDERLPADYRVSARPVLWASAVRLFERHPLEGAGLGAFAWRLPNVLAEQGLSPGISDNPGNGYLQALAESGAIGFALTLVFMFVAAREAVSSLRQAGGSAPAAGAGAALLGFLAALLTGSHWFSPDAAFLFFLLAAVAARPAPAAPRRWPSRVGLVGLGVYAAAAMWSAVGTLDAADAFRYSRRIGFHEEELGPGGAYRWTQRKFALRLLPGESDRIGLVHFTPEDRNVVLKVEADGEEALSRSLAPGEGTALRLAASPAAERVFLFTLSRAFVPRHLGPSRDRRELGVVAIFRPPR
jgi:O-antigen ligase